MKIWRDALIQKYEIRDLDRLVERSLNIRGSQRWNDLVKLCEFRVLGWLVPKRC